MTDSTEQPAASAAESGERLKRQRAAQQRAQRMLQLEQLISDGKARLGRCRAAARDAQRRLDALNDRVAEADAHVVALEVELGQLEVQAGEAPAPIDGEFDEVTP